MKNAINVAMSREIAYLLRDFSVKINETVRQSLFNAVFDYVNLLTNIKSKSSDKDLEEIWFNFEMKATDVFKVMKELRKNFCKERKQEAILLNIKLVSGLNNDQYIMMDIPIALYKIVLNITEKYPHLYHRKNEVSIREIIDRSVLLYVSQNDKLLENKVYRDWRVSLILEKEKIGKFGWERIMERVSCKKKVTWKDKNIEN